jgi:hypothetical protein
MESSGEELRLLWGLVEVVDELGVGGTLEKDSLDDPELVGEMREGGVELRRDTVETVGEGGT